MSWRPPCGGVYPVTPAPPPGPYAKAPPNIRLFRSASAGVAEFMPALMPAKPLGLGFSRYVTENPSSVKKKCPPWKLRDTHPTIHMEAWTKKWSASQFNGSDPEELPTPLHPLNRDSPIHPQRPAGLPTLGCWATTVRRATGWPTGEDR